MNSNKAVNVEKDISEIYVTKIEDRYARANHFIAKKDDLPEEPVSSRIQCAIDIIPVLDEESFC